MSVSFRIGVTRDFLLPDGSVAFGDIGTDLFDAEPGVEWEYLPRPGDLLTRELLDCYDGLLLLGPRVTRDGVAGVSRLKAVARFGVGYDNVDVPACTESGVLLLITPDAVRRPVATAALTFLLSLSHRLLEKHALTRDGRWGEKLGYMGYGLTGRALGIIGFGNIGQEIARLAAPLEMQRLATDPAQPPAAFAAAGVEQTDLDALLRRSDFVIVACVLNDATHRLIGEREIGLMKESAFLINIARGPIVDQRALEKALRERRIRGAALDVFDPEPPDPADPILRLDNVLLAPHAICWTDECFHGIGRSACRGLLDVAAGRIPRYVVNRDALGHPRLAHLRDGGSEP